MRPKIVRKKTKPGDKKPQPVLAPLEPVCPVQTAYLDALTRAAAALPKGREWDAFDPSDPGYEGLHVVKLLAHWLKEGWGLSEAVRNCRESLERDAIDNTWKRRQRLMLDLAAIEAGELSDQDRQWRRRVYNRWLWQTHKRMTLRDYERAQALVKKHKEAGG